MINHNGESIYTVREIALELRLLPSTVKAIRRKLFGKRTKFSTLNEAKLIAVYVLSLSGDWDTDRLGRLRETMTGILPNGSIMTDKEICCRMSLDFRTFNKED